MLSRSRSLSWALLAAVGVATLAFGATDDRGPQTDTERVSALASTIACPQCTGQPVSDSNATIAESIRAQIKQQVDAGMTDSQIRQVYIDRYGEWVDLNPSRSGVAGVVWIAPFLVIGAATGALALAFSRWRAVGSGGHATAADRMLVDSALGRAADPPAEDD